jgi:alkylhydroperoxidase family enzyme
MRHIKYLFLLLICSNIFAEEIEIPKTREEMKILLEELKYKNSRLQISKNENIVNNKMAKQKYLPESWYAADFKNDPKMTLSYELKTQCFWVVSRANNCYYCLGHQEHKLKDIGFSDEKIALLDYDWEKLPTKVNKAINLAKKITLQPHEITDEDIINLSPEFSNNEIIELVYTVSMFNSVNRWTGATGLPQDGKMKGKNINFPVGTLNNSESLCIRKDKNNRETMSLNEIINKINKAKTRICRVNLLSENEAKKNLSIDHVEDWQKALAVFPTIGKQWIDCLKSMEEEGNLNKRVKAIISWTTAQQNKAYVSLEQSLNKMDELNIDPSDIEEMSVSDSEKAIITFTKKLTEYPQFIGDEDINKLKKFYEDKQIAEIIYLIGTCNMFDRFTETLKIKIN